MTRAGAGGCILALAALLPGCAFDQGGLPSGDGGGTADASGPPSDAPPGTPDARRPIDAATPIDAAESTAGLLISRRTGSPPALDANPADWSQADWIGYAIGDSATFGWRHASYTDDAAIQFASLHDSQYIYFFFDVDDSLIITDSTALYDDDAVNLYLDAAGDRSGPYGFDDHELVIDADGVYDDYATGAATLVISGVAQRVNGGYRIELSLSKSSLGAGTLPGTLGFDIAITDDDGLGSSQSDCHGLWYIDPPPYCGSGCCASQPQPWCDTSTLGRLVLAD